QDDERRRAGRARSPPQRPSAPLDERRDARGQAGCEHSEGLVREVIRDVRIPHRVDVEEAHGGEEDAAEEEESRERTPPDSVTEREGRGERREGAERGGPLPWGARVDGEPRIDERELRREEELAEVEREDL